MRSERFTEAVSELYEAAADAVRLRALGPTLARHLGSESSIAFVARKPSAQLIHLVSASNNFDACAQRDYRAYYHERNEWFLRGVRRKPPFVARGSELIEDAAFDRTEFCTDWCRRVGIYHLLAATFPLRGNIVGAIGFHRERRRRHFGGEEKRFLQEIVPHLARAIQIAHKLGVFQREGDLTLEILQGLGVGVLLLDADCRPLFLNAVAERLVRNARWFALGAGRIRAIHPASTADFERAVVLAAGASAGNGRGSGGVIRLRDPLDASLAVLIAPFRSVSLDLGPMLPTAAVVFSDPDQPPAASAEAIAGAYRLSPAEARLAAALVNGHSLPSHARQAEISVNTAKAQLRSIYAKTGLTSQTQLVGAIRANPVLRLDAIATRSPSS